MSALQREIGHLVMIELGILPILVVVAFFAVGAVAAFMAVVFCVAAYARHWRFLDTSVGSMAACTGCGGMCAEQRKTCFLGMIEFYILPVTRCVTIGAGGSALTFVRIVLGVAGDAGFLRFAYRIVGAVAASAGRSGMLAQQRERRVAIMIERCRFPVGRVVAGRAIGATRPLVHIVACVASCTLLRQPLPPLTGMAAHTIGTAVLTRQRETGFGMAVRQDGLPACHCMTALAVSTQPTEMRIFLGVTADASCRGRSVIGAFGMATRTCCLRMPADKRVVGQTMVEFCRCKRDQSMPAPVMLAMAGLALLRPGVGFSMKTCGPTDVAGNPFVAC